VPDAPGRRDVTAFTRTRAALEADRPHAAFALLAVALLVLALGGAWAARAQLKVTGTAPRAGDAQPAAARTASPAALTLRASDPRPPRP
jgi:hypothetical protein